MRGRGLRLLVGLTTLAGVDRRPGQLVGFGFVHAELARRISAAPAARWCYALVHPDGTPVQVGLIRRRPTRPWADGPIPDYQQLEVWLQLTLTDTPRRASVLAVCWFSRWVGLTGLRGSAHRWSGGPTEPAAQ